MSQALLAAAAALLVAVRPAQAAGGGLEIFPDPVQLLILMALFALLVLPVNRLLLQPMLAVLDERDERIRGAREQAVSVAEQADAVLASYQAKVDVARAEAEVDRRSQVDEARGQQASQVSAERRRAEQTLDGARREVRAALEEARVGLRAQADGLARDAAERMLGRSLT